MNPEGKVTIAIMAGGASRRMGQDKAMLQIDGVTMLERIAGEALKSGCEVIVVGRGKPHDWLLPDVSFITDDAPGNGPLGGLATALRTCGSSVLAVACDMPMLQEDAFDWLLSLADTTRSHRSLACGELASPQAKDLWLPNTDAIHTCHPEESSTKDLDVRHSDMSLQTQGTESHLLGNGIIVHNDGEPEPLFSIYTFACLPHIELMLTEGRRAMKGLIEHGDFASIDAPEWIAGQLVNINTVEDVAREWPVSGPGEASPMNDDASLDFSDPTCSS